MQGQEELQGYLTADLGSLVEAVLERQPQLLCPVRAAVSVVLLGAMGASQPGKSPAPAVQMHAEQLRVLGRAAGRCCRPCW